MEGSRLFTELTSALARRSFLFILIFVLIIFLWSAYLVELVLFLLLDDGLL
jgi:hypothetical protein